MPGDIDIRDDSAFDHANSQMGSIAGAFRGGMQEAANNSASPAAAGTMPEGVAFMQNERQSRELLVQYMTKTSDGLTGYQTAIAALGQEHHGLVTLNSRRMQSLLRPQEGAMPNDQVFDWHQAVDYQLAHPTGGN